MIRRATTQAELDAAFAESREHPGDFYDIRIDSPSDMWIVVGGNPDRTPSGSATVEAYGSATVEASDSATVGAYGSATVRAHGSATVEASDSATVEASGSATVRAYGSATVRASGSATVRAYGSATVEAYGSATVEASDSATVRAYGSATVNAGSHVAVHLHSDCATVRGGVLIDHTAVDLADTTAWAGYHGAHLDDGHLVAFKAVRDDYRSARGTSYRPGSTASCDDFTDIDECGGGLHFSPTPWQARQYDMHATRYIELRVPVGSVRTITGGGAAKAKAPSVECVREVDIDGKPLTGGAQ